jgi:hypothetical protein
MSCWQKLKFSISPAIQTYFKAYRTKSATVLSMDEIITGNKKAAEARPF